MDVIRAGTSQIRGWGFTRKDFISVVVVQGTGLPKEGLHKLQQGEGLHKEGLHKGLGFRKERIHMFVFQGRGLGFTRRDFISCKMGAGLHKEGMRKPQKWAGFHEEGFHKV